MRQGPPMHQRAWKLAGSYLTASSSRTTIWNPSAMSAIPSRLGLASEFIAVHSVNSGHRTQDPARGVHC
jgi:hypothetical protein